ncbi:type I-F CRISPR-associated protein Csy1 [Serratia microhaemolytica]|uniref:type I-F CRISPR-associated protein Csy1 n=1 Tax=Serratia microhaemolytica TaxID=2675110 RepID=UPI000FDEDE8E|nr:type I-F CRISPR-associated protein Csy1 [Serratia microhaemolytica]
MNDDSMSSAIDDYISKKQQDKPDKWPTKVDWLDDAAKRAKQITLVTHAPKFTHGDTRGSGCRVEILPAKSDYLATTALTECAFDVIGNAAALDVANFLLIEAEGKRLMEMINTGDTSALARFATQPAQLTAWLDGFSQALLNDGTAKSHTLSKQTYFPVADGQYHLLSPLFASSLYHALHQRIEQARFSESAKAAREARRKGEFSATAVVEFPNLAEQHFGGTKPQNVSLLNSKRGGRAYLLSALPPSWRSNRMVPASKAQFWRQYSYRVSTALRELTQFLQSVKNKENNQEIKQQRAELVDILIAEFYQYAAELRCLPSGWSHPLAQTIEQAFCYWLDPGAFEQPPRDWPHQVAHAFGQWLTQQLQKTLQHVGDIELNVWRRQVERELRLLKQDLEQWA